MTATEIKTAVEQGKKVYWDNPSYQVIKDNKGEFLIKHQNGHCIGLTWADGQTLNGKEESFFIEEEPTTLKQQILNAANRICKEDFMTYPDYDKEEPITDLSGALTVILMEHPEIESDSEEVYGFIKELTEPKDNGHYFSVSDDCGNAMGIVKASDSREMESNIMDVVREHYCLDDISLKHSLNINDFIGNAVELEILGHIEEEEEPIYYEIKVESCLVYQKQR